MTTELSRSINPRLPRPDAYATHLERVLKEPAKDARPWALLMVAGMLLALTALIYAP